MSHPRARACCAQADRRVTRTAAAAAFAACLAFAAASARATDGAPSNAASERSPWRLQGDLGIPRFQSSDPSVTGGADLAYSPETWGLGGRAWHSVCSDESSGVKSETLKTTFGVRAWFNLIGLADLTLAAQIEGDAAFYSTSHFGEDLSGKADETSDVTHFTLLGKLHGSRRARFFYEALVGLGPRFDSYSRSAAALDAASVPEESYISESFCYRVRLHARYSLSPGSLSLRGLTDVLYYHTDRTSFDDASDANNQWKRVHVRSVEWLSRAYGDIDSLAFAGLVPSAFLGVDLYLGQGDSYDRTAWVPIVGIGLIEAR